MSSDLGKTWAHRYGFLKNDGAAIVMFELMVSVALQGGFDLRQSISQFITVAGGGVAVGLVFGLALI